MPNFKPLPPKLENYLKERPSTATAPPADVRMAKAQRWIPWQLKRAKLAGKKPSKVPIGTSDKPDTWNFFHAARQTLEDKGISGLGFQMLGRPGVVGIDLDNCVTASGERNAIASQLLVLLEAAGGKYHVEITPSGIGYRIFAAETPLPFHDFCNQEDGVEVYAGESGRFLTFTGSIVPGFGTGPFSPLPDEAIKLLGKYATKWKEGVARQDGQAVSPQQEDLFLPELARREDWKKLHPEAFKRLSKEHKAFLETGALGGKFASASEQLFSVMQSLIKHLGAPQAYQLLISAEGSWGVALDHREHNERRALQFIWSDLNRAKVAKEKHEGERNAQAETWKECEIEIEHTDDGPRAKIRQINQIKTLIRHSEWINRLGYNTFDGRVTLDRKDMTMTQLAEISAWVTDFLKWQFEPNRVQFEESVTEAAKTRPWNPIEISLRGYVWDNKPRVKKMAQAMLTEPSALDAAILRKWLIGYVARGINPGCQMDNVLCLRESGGGGFKSTFARTMAGDRDRFTDSPGFGTDKDSAMLRGGMRIVELGEGVAVSNSSRQEMKRDIVKLDDHFRPPWGRTVEKRKRGFVYILTANPYTLFRSDQDGLRRFWPLDVAEVIDIDWIKENLEQLLAEAVVAYDAGEEYWWNKFTEPKDLKIRQQTTVAEDFLDAAVDALIADPENIQRGYTTLSDIKTLVQAAAGVDLGSRDSSHLIDILGKHGVRPFQGRVGGKKLRGWSHASWMNPQENQEPGKVLSIQRGGVQSVPPVPAVPEGAGQEKASKSTLID